jgi:DNA (cytosine-5)-methyltransferase 1
MKAVFSPFLLNDNNKDCCKTLQKNHTEANVVCCSMEELNITEYIGKVDLLTGGVPCQSFSQSGLRKGLDDPRGELMIKFIDMIYKIKPKIFMIENVKGLITHNSGETIKEIIKLLDKDGIYNIEYKLLNSANYSVPQKRERVFIIGTLKSQNINFKFPDVNETPVLLKNVLYNVPASSGAKYNEEKINLFKLIPQGGCWINLPEDKQKTYLGNSFYSGGGKRGILYRLSMEKPSLTLLCTPSQKQTERCHPLEERPLTIREYARIQTFDDNYEFIGGLASQYKQIGNAVPVELARQIGINLIKALQNL